MEVTFFKKVQEDNEAVKEYLLDKVVELKIKIQEQRKEINELENEIYDLKDDIEALKQEKKEKKDICDYFEEL